MEQDRLRAPRWMVVSLPLLFAGVAIGFPAMLTVSFGDQTPLQFPAKLPDWLDRAATSAAGGVVGLIVARLTRWVRLRQRQTNASLPMAFALIGLALGWQAVLTIALFWLMALNVLRLYGGRRLRPRWLTPTTLLFVIAMLHHPAWKWLAGHLSI